jgi:hypothetical protein
VAVAVLVAVRVGVAVAVGVGVLVAVAVAVAVRVAVAVAVAVGVVVLVGVALAVAAIVAVAVGDAVGVGVGVDAGAGVARGTVSFEPELDPRASANLTLIVSPGEPQMARLGKLPSDADGTWALKLVHVAASATDSINDSRRALSVKLRANTVPFPGTERVPPDILTRPVESGELTVIRERSGFDGADEPPDPVPPPPPHPQSSSRRNANIPRPGSRTRPVR